MEPAKKSGKVIRVDGQVIQVIERAQRPRETVNDVLRRLLRLDARRHNRV